VTQQARQLAWSAQTRFGFSSAIATTIQAQFRCFVLPPAFGAVLMSLSTVIVAINAQLLRRANL
jgi:Cu2+-exporting ATPase